MPTNNLQPESLDKLPSHLYARVMGKTIKAIRRGIKAAFNAARSHKYEAAGKTIVCSHCGHDEFERAGLAGMTHAGYGVKCCHCSHIEYFGKQPAELDGSVQS